MLIQVITEVKLIVVPGVPQMDMVYLVRKSVFGVSLIKWESVRPSGHDGEAVLLQCPRHILHVAAFRYFDQHINDILLNQAEVERFDLITLNFFIFSQKLEEHPNNKARFILFEDSTNQILDSCGMGGLYISNPYECFVMMCVLCDDPLGTYADVCEISYEEEK